MLGKKEVPGSVNPKDLKELVAYVKARPGKVSFATSGSKNIPHLVGETFNDVAQVDMLNIPYKGSQQAATDTIAGRTDVYIDAVPPMAPFIGADGKLRPIAVTTAQRLPGHDDIPTAREQGVELVMQGWMAFLAPAGTPAPIVERVARDVNNVLARPDTVARLRMLGTFELGGTTAAFDNFVGEGDPALRLQVAHDTAGALLARVREGADPVVVERLVSFGTRHTMSVQDDPKRGIGAAVDWGLEEFRRIGAQ